MLGLGLFSLEVRIMGPGDCSWVEGGGVRCLCAQSRTSGFQLFTGSEIPIIRGVQWGGKTFQRESY